jgi:hypothetical protein
MPGSLKHGEFLIAIRASNGSLTEHAGGLVEDGENFVKFRVVFILLLICEKVQPRSLGRIPYRTTVRSDHGHYLFDNFILNSGVNCHEAQGRRQGVCCCFFGVALGKN